METGWKQLDLSKQMLAHTKHNVWFVSLSSADLCRLQAISRMGGLWRKQHTVWVNVGGLHAGVFLLKRTGAVFGQTPEDVYESRGAAHTQDDGQQLS